MLLSLDIWQEFSEKNMYKCSQNILPYNRDFFQYLKIYSFIKCYLCKGEKTGVYFCWNHNNSLQGCICHEMGITLIVFQKLQKITLKLIRSIHLKIYTHTLICKHFLKY